VFFFIGFQYYFLETKWSGTNQNPFGFKPISGFLNNIISSMMLYLYRVLLLLHVSYGYLSA